MRKRGFLCALALVAILLFTGCAPAVERLEGLASAAKVEIQSGNTGKTAEITDDETIALLAQSVPATFTREGSSQDYTGWSYAIRWYDADEHSMAAIAVTDETTIQKDGCFYTASQGTIDVSLLAALLEQVPAIESPPDEQRPA